MVLDHEQAEEATVGRIRNTGNQAFRYGECTKNHASAINLKAFDGCLEFMPAGDVGTLEALMCAACSCHRNFHRKEPIMQIEPAAFQQHDIPRRWEFHMTPSQPSGSRNSLDPGFSGAVGSSKRRVRTKFTREQKDRMLAFAQRVGWRVNKEHERDVQRFCEEIRIDKIIFKVWMRNNKHTLGKVL
ncbi:hypothetical protein E3N88_23818 [Mikania micrantha]|uniref:ZF-HD dimerization-type domain-containing protein n=1 Tax=Mikania micrantha TaxID=192012 RepID=A0A5N6NGD9_9ASTR|nr:hypothetical protein E3N88_23818 [Mikania micrantha]